MKDTINITHDHFKIHKKGQDLDDLRSTNMSVLLSAIWDHAPVARSDLSQMTGLAPSSITRLLQILKSQGLIREGKKGHSSGGRLPQLVEPDPEAGLIVCLDISGSLVRAGVYNTANQLVQVLEQPFQGFGPDAVRKQIISLAHSMMENSQLHPPLKFIGIGVCQPGTLDISNGIIGEAVNLRLKNFPIHAILSEEFHLPIFIEQDALAAALAEKTFGAGRGLNDMIYIMATSGVGAGIISNGQIYRGSRGRAGEIGHIVVDRVGPICSCGKRGCLESIAGKPAILSQAQRILVNNQDAILAGIVGDNPANLTLEVICQAANAGSQIVQELIDNAIEHLAIGIQTLATLVDIQVVIFGGDLPQMDKLFFEKLQKAVDRLQKSEESIMILPSQLQSNAFLRGIGMLTLQRIISE